MTTGTKHTLLMQGDRLILEWEGIQFSNETRPAGVYASDEGMRCSGVVDLTAHFEEIVKRILSARRAAE